MSEVSGATGGNLKWSLMKWNYGGWKEFDATT